VVHTPKAPLDRNRDIVDAAAVLIAAPKEMTETLRSGTWATVRYARKQGKQVWIVWPDGTVSKHESQP
jgi:predicted Rossmann fold nucleotide-binding protein DprA/Smf involved in DNA uptake